MEDLGRQSFIRNFAFVGKRSLIPSRGPSHHFSPPNSKYTPGSALEYPDNLKPKGPHLYHHRVSSDTIFIEEQPAWLDDLLNDPESPAKSKGHRRAASDTSAYFNKDLMPFGADNKPNIYFVGPSGLFQSIDCLDDMWRSNPCNKQQDRGWELSTLNDINLGEPVPLSSVNKVGTLASKSPEKQVQEGKEVFSARSDGPASKNDSKRVKQQNARRARLRRLHYISELESNIQMLQAEGCEVSSAIHFLDQQLLVLSMENRALKQRMDTMAQIQKLKQVEQEMLEREIGRLQFLHHHQQQKQQRQQPPKQLMQQNQYTYRPPAGQELEHQFAALSI